MRVSIHAINYVLCGLFDMCHLSVPAVKASAPRPSRGRGGTQSLPEPAGAAYASGNIPPSTRRGDPLAAFRRAGCD